MFYCIVDQINAALVSIKYFQNALKILQTPTFVNMCVRNK